MDAVAANEVLLRALEQALDRADRLEAANTTLKADKDALVLRLAELQQPPPEGAD